MLGVDRFPVSPSVHGHTPHKVDIYSIKDTHKLDDPYANPSAMPVDFQSYLLAASPPGFDLHYAIREHFPNRTKEEVQPQTIISSTKRVSRFDNSSFGSRSICVLSPHQECTEETIQNPNVKLSESIKKSSSNGLCKLTKRVSFADDLGGPLVQIRILTARPESPPLLHPEILSSLTKGSSAGVSDLPPIKLNFSQPASDYVAFRNKLESNFVALENVILKDYNLAGTIKVKNIAFEKKVFVRYSTDCWESFTDVDGSYIPTSNGVSLPFDTFSFEIHVSPKMDVSKKLQFAVLFEANCRQYWDNNNGENFEVVSSDWKEKVVDNHNTTDVEVYSTEHSNSWTEFCGWNKMSASTPYY